VGVPIRVICALQGSHMTILVRCSDPRIQKYLEEVGIGGKTGALKDHAVIANTGSIKYFMAKNQMEDFYGQLDILIPHFHAEKIVLLNHTDCGFYKKLGQDTEENYLKDLREVKELLLQKYPEVAVEGYLLDTETGNLKEIE